MRIGSVRRYRSSRDQHSPPSRVCHPIPCTIRYFPQHLVHGDVVLGPKWTFRRYAATAPFWSRWLEAVRLKGEGIRPGKTWRIEKNQNGVENLSVRSYRYGLFFSVSASCTPNRSVLLMATRLNRLYTEIVRFDRHHTTPFDTRQRQLPGLFLLRKRICPGLPVIEQGFEFFDALLGFFELFA